MTFRGIFQDGVVVPDTDLPLRDGDIVEFFPAATPRKRRAVVKKAIKKKKAAPAAPKRRRMTAAQRLAAFQAGFGMWKDRPDWEGRSSAEIARELRARAAGLPYRG